ncbi:MAG: hypothetical protein GY861_04160 [bacterium]|nr:hypothetical protein [bacterium]
MVVGKGTVDKDAVTVILEDIGHLRAVAYVYRDGSGRTELQRKITPNSNWMTALTEERDKAWMQEHTLLPKADECVQCGTELIQNHCNCEQRGQ